MATTTLKIGIAGCGHAARDHLSELLALDAVQIVGCADPDLDAARRLAERVSGPSGPVPAFADHKELLKQTQPDALAIFTPTRLHYRPVMDALQAECHVLLEKPLSTNSQEGADIVNLARGRDRKVAVGHQFRLQPSLIEARRLLADGAIGPVRLVTATLTQPWLAMHRGTPGNAVSWRVDPKVSGGGLLADVGDHLLDALLWTTGQRASEVAAFQTRSEPGLDVVTAAALRLEDGTPATLALCGDSPGFLFELTYLGEGGRLRATDQQLLRQDGDGPEQPVRLPEPAASIAANFVAALRGWAPLCCPADQALETVRVLEAIARSATAGQVVRLTS